jgi:4-hydroxy-tetrahydrodipicolinate synthase
MKFLGSLVAIASPFHEDGSLDKRSLEGLVEWHIAEGTDGIVCSGATGESVCLSETDRLEILEVCLKTSAGRIPIIAGTGTPNTRETVRLTEQAQKAGAAGCLVITPFYNKPSARGCVLHYREVAKIGLPVVVYHNPGRTQVRLSAESLAEIGAIKGISALKDSSGDKELIRELGNISSFPILSGDDWMTFETLQMGGVGAISVIGNIIPRAWKEMIHLSLQGRFEEAKRISDRFQPLCQALFLEVNPQCVKYTMSLMGKCGLTLRLPLVPPLEESRREVKKVLLNLALPFQSTRSHTKCKK